MIAARITLLLAASLSAAGLVAATPQGAPDPAALIAAQRDAMKKLAFLDGNWRGAAWTILPNGEKHEVTQTERCGPLLDESIRIVEGRGYDAEGKTSFNALGVLTYDPAKQAYSMRSHAQGRVGDFPVKLADGGFSWEIAAGPMTIRYTATIKGDAWHEVGDRIASGKEPVRFFEMTLKRLGDTSWPAANPVGPK